MTLTRTLTAALALTLAGALPTLADDAAKQRGDALLKSIKYDGKLYGTYWMGVYYGGTKNIGHMKMTVESTPPGGEGYWVKTKVRFSFGPMSQLIEESSMLGPDMRRLTIEGKKVEAQNGVKVTTLKKVTVKGKEWVGTLTRGEKSRTTRVPYGPDHYEVAQRLMLARKLPLDKPATYELKGVKWPTFAAGEGASAEWRAITITVPKATDYVHRGKKIKAHLIEFKMEKDEDEVIAVDANNNVLALWPKSTPIKLIAAADEKQAKADLSKAAESPDVRKIKRTVKVYFEVVFKVKQVDALDKVVDWVKLKENLTALQPSLKDQTAEDFATQTKAELKSVEVDPAGKEILGLLDTLLEVKVKGDTAKVTMNQEQKVSFELAKQKDGSWKMVRVPLGD